MHIVLHAADEAVLPDFSNAYPGEKMFKKHKREGFEDYRYHTNLTFDQWRQGMAKFLGEGWKEEKLSDKELDQYLESVGRKVMEISGMARFSSEPFPGIKVEVMHLKMLGSNGFKMRLTTLRKYWGFVTVLYDKKAQ